MLKLYNSFNNLIEEADLNKKEVKIYLCGPTVQSSPHLGHGRSAVVFDFLIRYLKYLEYEEKIRHFIRWNSLLTVLKANKESDLGGHISTYSSAATLYEVGDAKGLVKKK